MLSNGPTNSYAVQHGRQCCSLCPPVYLLQAGGGRRSRVELLAELRDLKRRTTSYRAKKQRTALQVMQLPSSHCLFIAASLQ